MRLVTTTMQVTEDSWANQGPGLELREVVRSGYGWREGLKRCADRLGDKLERKRGVRMELPPAGRWVGCRGRSVRELQFHCAGAK